MASVNVVYPVDILLPLSWWEVTRYRLRDAMEIHGIRIPKGFTTDGATVPRLFWFLFPPVDRYFPAAVVHDYLLTTGVSWRVANRHFRRILRELQIRPWRRWMMSAGVGVYGFYREMCRGD